MDSINGFVWSRKQKVTDDYCWTCHSSEPTLFCVSCVRSFHESTACSHSKKMTAEAIQTWRCPECCAIETDEQQINAMQINAEYVNKVLKFVLDLLLADDWLKPHFREIDYSKSGKSIAYAMDLLEMSKKIENQLYQCYEAFLADIKWIVHNTKSRNPPKSRPHTATCWLTKFTRTELDSIRLCHECYVNANEHPNEWVSMVCNGQHPVVWAKFETYPYWPAKLMGRNERDGTVDVRFFGDNTSATIPSNHCTKYTENCPSIHLGKDKDAWNNAQEAAKVYINNLTSTCGPEIMSNPKIPKPIPARRLTISGHDLNKPRSSTVAAARIAKRRSTNFDSKTNTNIINHQSQRVQFGRIKSTNQKATTSGTEANSKFSIKIGKADLSGERGKSLERPTKKQKLDQNSNGETSKSKQSKTECDVMAGQNENLVGKNETPSESTLPMISFNAVVSDAVAAAAAPTINEIRRDENGPNPDRPITVTPSISQQLGSLTKSEVKSYGKEANSTSSPSLPLPVSLIIKSSPELKTKCEHIVERAMQKYTELTRSSFETIVLGLLSDHENQLESMENKLKRQRLEYDGIIDALRASNQLLTDECRALRAENVNLINQNTALTNATNAAKADDNKLKTELEIANGKISTLHGSIKEMVNQNGVFSSKVDELQKLNAELTTIKQVSHEKLKGTMSELQKASQDMASNGRDFNQFCEQLKTKFHGINSNNEVEMNRLRQQNEWQAHQMQHMRNTFEVMKRDAIAETKKWPWCQGCGNPGDPHYCNRCRLDRISRNQHTPIFGQRNLFFQRRM